MNAPLSAPIRFGLLAATAYALLLLPIMAHHGWDPSFFVIAGDHFVDAGKLAAPIVVRPGSAGYDGQFYYRMAVAPFSFAPTANGIWFDVPVYRSQRFLYPLLAWALSLGRPGGAAAALLAVNLLGIGAACGTALALVRRLGLPDATAWAIAAWPGLLVTLTHDTAEIVALAFLLGALLCRLGGRGALFVLLAAAATLARETTAPALAGLLAWDAVAAGRSRDWRNPAQDALALLPLLAWHAALPGLWGAAGSEGVWAHDLGWPLLGLVRAFGERMREVVETGRLHGQRMRAVLNLLATAVLLGFAARAASAVVRAIRHKAAGPVVAAFLPTLLLLALLREGDGPFATPFEFCRAFTEFWALGCIVIAAAGKRARPPLLLAAAMAVIVVMFTRSSFGLAGL